MTLDDKARREEIRRFHARMMAAASNSSDPRFERIFALVPREVFMGPGPWHMMVNRRYLETPDADPVHLYQNVLVALDVAKGINNGEPFLHAAWIGAASPRAGDTISHIGAGTGYYTALLAMLALPGGSVRAFEIDADLARRARENLVPFEGVSVVAGDATALPLPASDLIYVNAGVLAPPLAWLEALRPGGRMILPWQPTGTIGLALLVTRAKAGFAVRPLMPAWFIPCIGASDPGRCTRAPDIAEAWSVRSAWPTAERPPDETAVAIYRDVWFSRAAR